MRSLDNETAVFSQTHLPKLKDGDRMCPKLMIYDYAPLADLTNMPYWIVPAILGSMPIYKKHPVIGFNREGLTPTSTLIDVSPYFSTREPPKSSLHLGDF